MALKDCKFFVNVNGKKTEMDYDQFRAYLLEDANLNAVAPDLTRKKGAKAGYEVTAPAPTATARAEAEPQKAEAAPAPAKPSPATPRPITVESLRETMNLTKAQAEAVLAVYEAMGLPLPTMRVAKGVFDKPELQEQYEKSMAEEGMLARGYIEFFDPDEAAKLDGVLAVIRGFGAANFSTPVHEGAHFYRRFMLNEENGFTAQEIKAAEDWAGAKNGEWSVAAEEKWARGFERYLRSGQAPIPALNKLFEKIARWMRKVYETVTGSAIDVEVSPEVKRVFDRIFEIQAKRQKGTTGTVAGGKRDVLSQEEPAVGPVWRSNIASALKTWNQDKGTPQQLMAHLGKVKGAQEEAKWIGLNEFLEGKKSVTKAEVADFVDSNPYIVEETILDETSTSESYLEHRFVGGEQYREIVLTSPKIQRFRNHHYPDTTESYLAHLRVSTFTSEKGERVLLVDEVQSDLHQKGRKLGYATPEEVARVVAEETARGERKTASYTAAVAAMRKAREQASALAASLGDKAITQDRLLQAATELAKQRPPRSEAQWQRTRQLDWISRQIQAGRTMRFRQRDLVDRLRSAGLVKDFVQIVEAVQGHETGSQTYSRLLTEDEQLSNVPIIPEAPFRESNDWAVMLFKRAVRLAAEEGADFVAWTPGEVQKERYPNGGAKLVKFYNEILPKALAKFARQWGGNLETVALKKPSVKKGEELPLGQPLGATATERTFPAIRITPQMKAEAMKGFTLFQAEESKPGKMSAEAVKQKQAERARILKQEEPKVGPVWRSNIASALKTWNQDKGTPQQLMAHLGKVKGAQEEAKWIGLNEFLEGKKSVTKAEVADFVDSNPYVVDEVVLTGHNRILKHSRFRVAGGKNYREIILTSPKIENFGGPHYEGKTQSYLAHMRVADFEAENGESVFLVDEAQSDLHQKARKVGYWTSEQIEEYDKQIERYKQKAEEYSDQVKAAEALEDQWLSYIVDTIDDSAVTKPDIRDAIVRALHSRAFPPKSPSSWHFTASDKMDALASYRQKGATFTVREVEAAIAKNKLQDDFNRLLQAHRRLQSLRKAQERHWSSKPNSTFYPAAPFQESAEWATMLMKRAIRIAAEEGRDFVAWTPGKMQANRYGREELIKFYDEILPKALAKFVRQWGGKLETVALKKPPVRDDSPLLPGEELGATATERTFPAIRITPQMKAEAMKGFTLFQAEQGPGKVSAEAVKQKQAERARILKQEEPVKSTHTIDDRIAWYTTQIDAIKEEISRKTGKPFSLLTLAPRDLDAYERKLNEIEQIVNSIIKESEIEAQKPLVEKVALDWAGVSEVTPAEPPTPSRRFETGEPVLVKVYHGTGPEGIKGGAFSPIYGGINTQARSARQGYFFAGSQQTSEAYLKTVDVEEDWDDEDWDDEEEDLDAGITDVNWLLRRKKVGKIYEFYVKLNNPLVYDMERDQYRDRGYSALTEEAKKRGHDGVIITNTYDGGPLDNIFAVLHGYENQIKSADAITYGPDGKPVPLSERFNPKTTSIYFQDDRPVTASTDSAFVQRKMKERAERLRQAKAAQGATGEAKAKTEAKATPPPPPQAAKTARPSGTTRPSAPRQGRPKTDEQRLKDAKERAAKPPAEPSEETMVNRKVQAFINTFAKSLFAGSIPLTTTDAAGNQVDTESVFLDLLKQYRAAFAAADQGRVDAVSAKLREITRPPRAPKDLKQLMEEAKKRAGQPETAKTAAQKREQDIGKEVQKAINNFARLRSTGKISEMVDLGDGVTVSREDLLLQALADLQAAYRTSNTYLGAPEIAKAQRRIMDILFVPPRVPKKPYTAENILTAHAWGTASVRSPLSYLNMVGSYEAIAGELGARVSEIFQFTRTQMAHGYYPSWGAAITDLQRSLKGVKEELRQAGYPGMLPVIDAHVDRIRKSAEGVGALTPENVKKAWDNGNIGGLASNVAKAFVFNTSLRFSPKAVLMNYMQPLFTLFPHVTPKEFYNFWVDSGRPETIARVRDLALKESGGRIEGMGAEDRFFNPFTKASERARIMGHLAGEMMADRLNLKGLARDVYVRGWTEKVEFDNSAWNVPPAFSGNLNSVLFQFKPYVAKNVERFVADWKRGVEGSSSGTLARRAKLIGVQLGVGGIGSLLTIMPGVKGITGILILGYLAQAFSAATGDDELGEKMAEAVFYGAPAWIGLDLASSVGFLEEPFGDDTFQQALNLVAGPAVYKSAAAINGLRKYYEDAQKVAPLGKEKEKEEVLARRRRTVLNSITPLSRMAETAWSLAQGKRPDMFLEEPTPLQGKEVILRLLGGSPIRQTKFYDYKESFDWQKSLLNRPIDIPGIKRLKKETDATYKERVRRIEGWREQYRNELTSHPRFSRLSPEDQEKAFELLQRNITEQANQVRPNEAVLKPARILRSVMTSKVESKARARKRLYTEPED